MELYLIEGTILTPTLAGSQTEVFMSYHKAKEQFLGYAEGIKKLKDADLRHARTFNDVLDMVRYQANGKQYYLRIRAVEVEP